METLERRWLLTLVAPTWSSDPQQPPASVRYREQPDLNTDRVYLKYVDNNDSESGYRVEWSPDGANTWQRVPNPSDGGDWPAGSGGLQTATRILDAGQKEYYRV